MARSRRPYLPGACFHLVARTQDKIYWFEKDHIKDIIVGYIADAADACDVDLIAWAIMHNHLHLIVRQQCAPLAALMQPLLRRCALLTQRTFVIDGHTFSRSFRHRVCRTAEELRYCIGYVHRNPVAAGACKDSAEYPWCSHLEYAFPDGNKRRPKLLLPRELFGRGAGRTEIELCADYVTYVSEMEEAAAESRKRIAFPMHGDEHWVRICTPPQIDDGIIGADARTDLRDVVLLGIRRHCPELDITMVRSFRGAEMSRIRARLVEDCGRAGHRGCAIARYLHISETRVSVILKQQRVRRKAASKADS